MDVSLLSGPIRRGIVAACLLALLALPAPAAIDFDAARLNEIAARLPPKPAAFGNPISDRAAWAKLARTTAFGRVVSRAQSLAGQPVPALPDDLYLDYSRTGSRDRCQQVRSARSERITTFTLAEWLESQGRFLGPLSDTVSAICQEPTWVYPAHDGKLDNFYGLAMEMDLRAGSLAWELAPDGLLAGGDRVTAVWWTEGPPHYLSMKGSPPPAVLCLRSSERCARVGRATWLRGRCWCRRSTYRSPASRRGCAIRMARPAVCRSRSRRTTVEI